jgi:hypothetical protein
VDQLDFGVVDRKKTRRWIRADLLQLYSNLLPKMASAQQRQQLLGANTPHGQQQQQQQVEAREIQRLAPRMVGAQGEIEIKAMRRTYTLAKRKVYSAATRSRLWWRLPISGLIWVGFTIWFASGDSDNPNQVVFAGFILSLMVVLCTVLFGKRGSRNNYKMYAIWENAIMHNNNRYPWIQQRDGTMGWGKFLYDDTTDELSGVDPPTMVRNLTDNMSTLTTKLKGFNYNYSTMAQHLASDGLMGVTIEGHVGDRRDQYQAPPAAPPPTNPTAFQKAVPTAVAMPLPRPATGSAAPASKFCNQCAAKLTPGSKFCSQCAAPN